MLKKILLVSAGSILSFYIGHRLGSSAIKKSIHEAGNLRIDFSDEDEPMNIFLEVTDSRALMSSKYVTLKVVRENYISHKNKLTI